MYSIFSTWAQPCRIKIIVTGNICIEILRTICNPMKPHRWVKHLHIGKTTIVPIILSCSYCTFDYCHWQPLLKQLYKFDIYISLVTAEPRHRKLLKINYFLVSERLYFPLCIYLTTLHPYLGFKFKLLNFYQF